LQRFGPGVGVVVGGKNAGRGFFAARGAGHGARRHAEDGEQGEKDGG